ncbi:MAG: hypothetical protein RR750_02655, partial [Citrobacter sp.]
MDERHFCVERCGRSQIALRHSNTIIFYHPQGRVYFAFNTQNHSSCIKAARERIPGSIDCYVTWVSDGSQRRDSLKDEVYTGEIMLPDSSIRLNKYIS